MLWFAVWTLLALGALATAVVLWRRLWRQAAALGAELSRATEVTGRLADQATALGAYAAPTALPGALGDPPTLARARATRARVRDQRRRRSARRLQRAWSRWRNADLVP